MTDPTRQGLSFADVETAYRARNVIKRAAAEQIQNLGTNPQVGRVMSVDIARLTASVWFPGDDAPVQVGLFPGNIPLDLGDFRGTSTYETSAVGTGGLVQVEQFRGKPFITRILSGGEYTLNQRVAGLTHQTFNANRLGTISGPPVSDIYERHINLKVDGTDVTTGQCLLVGPWAGNNDGTQIDGIIELVISFLVTGSAKNCVRKYTFSVSDRQVVDLEGDEGNKAFWMRLVPHTTLQTEPHAELAVDVALVKTGIRAPIEFWFRLVPLDGWADQSFYYMSVKTYGSAFNVGDPRTGRMVTIKQDTVEPVQGYLGFHNSGMGFVERDEWPTYNQGISWWGDEWSTGPFRAAPLRAANDLRPLWRLVGGNFKYTGGHFFSWTGNIVFTGLGPNNNILGTGQIAVPFPDHAIPIFPTAGIGTYRSTAGGIGMFQGETLYYGLCPSIDQAANWPNLSNHFFIVDSKTFDSTEKSFALPEWAIPIAARAYTFRDGAKELIICSPHGEQMIDNEWEYAQNWYTSTHGPFIATDHTETMEIPSFTYRKGQAYKLSFKCGVISSSSTVDGFMGLRWFKGTTTAGQSLGEHFRYWMPRSGYGVGFAQGELYIVNNTGADITTQITLAGQTGTQAGSRYANSTSVSWVRAQWVGPASKYQGTAVALV